MQRWRHEYKWTERERRKSGTMGMEEGRGLVGEGLVPGTIVSSVSRWRLITSLLDATHLLIHTLTGSDPPPSPMSPSPPPAPSCVFGLQVRTSTGAVRQRELAGGRRIYELKEVGAKRRLWRGAKRSQRGQHSPHLSHLAPGRGGDRHTFLKLLFHPPS